MSNRKRRIFKMGSDWICSGGEDCYPAKFRIFPSFALAVDWLRWAPTAERGRVLVNDLSDVGVEAFFSHPRGVTMTLSEAEVLVATLKRASEFIPQETE